MGDILIEADRLGLKWGRADGVPVSRADFVAEARSWIGTKVMHQQEMKGVGVDCGGFVRGASVALGLIPGNYRHLIPEAVRGYARQPVDLTGQRLCEHYWKRIPFAEMRAGDVALIKFETYPQHVAILGDSFYGGLSMIHSYQRKVVEHQLDDAWRKRIVAAYSIPGVE